MKCEIMPTPIPIYFFTDINECEGQTCNGNGGCVDGIGTFTCLCQSGYTGKFCGGMFSSGVEGAPGRKLFWQVGGNLL